MKFLSFKTFLKSFLNIFTNNLDNGDGILLYCLKNLCPILGDKKYSSRVKEILGKLVYVPEASQNSKTNVKVIF